jgi:NADH:ubiquinone oxidoreductase subunit
MLIFFKRLVTWWNGQTLGTQLLTWRTGVKVGEDAQGNIFYTDRARKRRWVIFNGLTEATRVSPEWHGWLHHTWHDTPVDKPMVHKPWEKDHLPNLTGTPMAHAPAGSIRRADPAPRSDYEAWRPE